MSELHAADDPNVSLRWAAYGVLIALAAGNMAGRILAVNSIDSARLERYRIDSRLKEDTKKYKTEGMEGDALDERIEQRRAELNQKLALQRPFLSANDRSRWANVRALVEHGTYAIDDVIAEPNWDTIDMVQHKDRAGVPRQYSSKPPLLATLIAAPYWVIHKSTGWTLGSHPYEIGRAMLLLINVLPMIVMFLLVARMVEKLGTTDWGRIFVMGAATFGTFLNTFAVVLNNHLIAAVSATIALYAAVRILHDGDRRWRWFFLAGLFAAFTAANELPALSFTVALGALLAWRAPRETAIGFLPGVIVVAIAFFGTNYIAHESWRPPYAHRKGDPEDNWYHYTYTRNGREIESYWMNPSGIDQGESSPAKYALHVLIGHHGIFSLTPVWLLSFAGMAMWLTRRGDRRWLAAMILLISVVCIVFFLMPPKEIDRNYGGMTSGFRWMFWFAPMWLVAMLPAADAISSRRPARWLALLLLALSVLSASYPIWNPWTLPWISNWFVYMGWESW